MSTSAPIAVPAAGTHLLADFWGARAIGSVEELDALVRSAVASAGATLLELAFHQFPAHGDRPGAGALPGGITGYALLAESHISVHTWPERGYVALDVFMCGEQRPEAALEVMRRALAPTKERVRTVRRGIEEDAVAVRSAPERRGPIRHAPRGLAAPEPSAQGRPPSGPSGPSGLATPGIAASGLAVPGLAASDPAPGSPTHEPPLAAGSE